MPAPRCLELESAVEVSHCIAWQGRHDALDVHCPGQRNRFPEGLGQGHGATGQLDCPVLVADAMSEQGPVGVQLSALRMVLLGFDEALLSRIRSGPGSG